MRLLYTLSDGKLQWKNFIGHEIPRYAILSHTWCTGQEVTFHDLNPPHYAMNIANSDKDGYRKIRFCVEQSKRDGLNYFWVDTCCIDSSNSTEVAEAINSMFRWYQNAERCYVYLADVELCSLDGDTKVPRMWEPAFRTSRWFSRGFTLQELLAPMSVEFFSRDGTLLGDKESLRDVIQEITAIPIEALQGNKLSNFSEEDRFSWASGRQTTKEEDWAYSLLGIFGIYMPLIYGEGKENAIKRLRRKTAKASGNARDAATQDDEGRGRRQEYVDMICKWLAAPDPSLNYYESNKKRQVETGLWFIESSKFSIWKSNAPSRLWLYGIPGCGKTILSSTIIEHLLQHCQNSTKMVTVYFYFDFMDTRKQNPDLMMCSVLCQLLQHAATVPKSLDTLLACSGNEYRKSSLHALLEATRQMIKTFAHVYLVLDALDECTQLPELMDMLQTVADWELGNLHLLIASRKERDIESALGSFVRQEDTVCLQSDIVDNDIHRYVQNRLSTDKCLAKWVRDAAIKQDIETAIMRGARGMFQWAACQLNDIGKCRTRAELRKSLVTLPTTLDDTYGRILSRIGKNDVGRAQRILQWLAFSARPLFIEELAEVVAIDVIPDSGFDRDEVLVNPLEVLDICSSLITVTDREQEGWGSVSQTITLAHYSVKEYLTSDRIKQGPLNQYSMQEVECHCSIAMASLKYLMQFQQPLSEEALVMSVLARYSAKFWSSHMQKTAHKMEEISYLAIHLFSKENPAYLCWIQLCDPDKTWNDPDLGIDLNSTAAPIYYAVLLGLTPITHLLLKAGAQVNAQGGKYGNPLQAASWRGDEQMVKTLLDKGAYANSQGGLYGNALQAASAQGHTAIVEILLLARARVNEQGGEYGSALHAALAGVHESTARVLLENGADVRPDEQLKGAIHYAVDHPASMSSLVDVLLKYRAPVDNVDMDNMTPLHYCAKFSHKTIAERLINAGVTVDYRVHRRRWRDEGIGSVVGGEEPAPGSTHAASGAIETGLTPLHFAALTGKWRMIDFFLEHGADPNAVSDYGETPLHLTLRAEIHGTRYGDDWTDTCLRPEGVWDVLDIEEEDFAAVERVMSLAREEVLNALLADPRTSLTATDYKGESPLHCIQYNSSGSANVVRCLLEKGADLDCRNLKQQSPLHFASRVGDHASVRTLLKWGARAGQTDDDGRTALHYAARSGSHETIMAILDTEEAKAGNLLVIKDKVGQNVLHHLLSTTRQKRVGAVQLLLDHGANSSEFDDSGTSPLAKFIKRCPSKINVEILRILLAIEGNAAFVDGDNQTLGHLCARNFDFSVHVLEILHQHGVDLASKDRDGRTVLHRAAITGSLTTPALDFLVNILGLRADEKDIYGRTTLQYVAERSTKAVSGHIWDSCGKKNSQDLLQTSFGDSPFKFGKS